MEQKEQIRNGLQFIVTGLSQQADGHDIQSRVFASQGFSKLAEKYAEHATEERGYVNQIVDRMIDLGFKVENSNKVCTPVIEDPVEWIKYDLDVSVKGLAGLKELAEACRDDYATYDILREYYKDEEEDMFWGEAQLELISKIGVQTWLVQQL
ncbi:MAG: hypothetical protein IJ856_05360 [Candidatus Methanomethylophilaceae archaeon]|nr:hypothetical protein [Candidatus Methanomethylophilaceae archaeon]